ncbi:drug/metabolite transporter (DMT)-like permease [Rhodococcus sp. 27YEA15]
MLSPARLIPLFLSQTVVSANLVITAVLGTIVLGIQLHRRDWFAISVVILSLLLLAIAAGHGGGGNSNPVVHWGVLGGSGLVLLAGVGVIRALGSRAAVAAGLISGILFGCLAIAVRVVEGIDPFDVAVLLRDPAAWAIVVAGVGGFYLHTVALQLGSVNGATAALVVGETVVPGIVGVTVLGDSSRAGLEWLAVLGFVGAIAGAVAVAVFGAAHSEEPVSHT